MINCIQCPENKSFPHVADLVTVLADHQQAAQVGMCLPIHQLQSWQLIRFALFTSFSPVHPRIIGKIIHMLTSADNYKARRNKPVMTVWTVQLAFLRTNQCLIGAQTRTCRAM